MTHCVTTRRRFVKTTLTGAAAFATGNGVLQLMACSQTAKHKQWIDLFDRRTLAGWHKNPQPIGHGTGGQWGIDDGAIAGEQDPPASGNGGILLTDKKFADFDLSLDLKPDWGVCSGLFLRSTDGGACFQMMVDYHDGGNIGHLYGEGTGGWNLRTFNIDGKYDAEGKLVGLTSSSHRSVGDVGLEYSCTAEAWLQAWKINDWNNVRVVVKGKYPRITTWINDLKVCEFDGERTDIGNYSKDDVLGTLGAEGSIAVQVHGGGGWPDGAKCRWKNIKIREL